MEFGKVLPAQLALVDFTLPPDPELTTCVLQQSNPTRPLQVYVGCSTWANKEWRGYLFSPRTKDTDYLREYARQFNCIELNATFYQIFNREVIDEWREKTTVNPNFKFCPKFNQLISHEQRLRNVQGLISAFYDSVLAFEDKLGPMFLQLNDHFSPAEYPFLKDYLTSLPFDLPVFTELRHRDWFAQPATRNTVFELMERLHTGAVITDTTGRRDCVHMYLTIPHAFIRFVGNGLHPTDYQRIDSWVERISAWASRGLQSVCFLMHQPDPVSAASLCDYVLKRFNEQLALHLKRPQFLPVNGLLF